MIAEIAIQLAERTQTMNFGMVTSPKSPVHAFAPSITGKGRANCSGESDVSSQQLVFTSEPMVLVSGEFTDWEAETTHKKFFKLEGVVESGRATPAEKVEYQKLLLSRRAFNRCQTYLQDYMEEERQKELIATIKKLRSLISPIALK